MANDEQDRLDAEVRALMLDAVSVRRPEVAKRLRRTALSPQQIAELLKTIEAQESASTCEFAKAFPALARAAMLDAEDEPDPSVEAYLARMRRLDEQLFAEEIELRGKFSGRGR